MARRTRALTTNKKTLHIYPQQPLPHEWDTQKSQMRIPAGNKSVKMSSLFRHDLMKKAGMKQTVACVGGAFNTTVCLVRQGSSSFTKYYEP